MSNAPLFRTAVVVATLGRSPVLAQALTAIDQQRDQIDLTLVVVAQGPISADALDTIRSAADQCFEEERPLGFAAANNLAIRSLLKAPRHPDFIALVNDDAILSQNWLHSLIASLESEPDAASAQGLNLQPVRDHFENDAEAKALLKQVKSYKTTR